MNHELQAGKNFAWMTIAQIILRILGMGFFVLMTYKLNETGVGQYSFITSFVLFWFIFSDFGSGTYLYREWSRGDCEQDKIRYDFNVSFTIRSFVSVLVFIPFLIFNYYSNKEIILPLILFFITTSLSVFSSLGDSYLQSANLFRYAAIKQIIEKLVTVVLGCVLLFIWPRLEMVFIAMLVAQTVSLLYYYLFALPFKFKFVFDKRRTKELIVKGFPFLFVILFTSIYSRIDMVMLRYMGDFESVGLYSTAYRFLDLASIFTAALLMPAIYPVLSSLYRESADKFNKFFYKSLRIIFSSSLLLTIFFIFFSPLLITTFFSASFGPSVLALRILILIQILGALSILFNSILFIQNKEKIGLAIIIFSACFNIVLNIFLIPRYSLYGAAWATVIAEVVNLSLLQYFAHWNKERSTLIKMFGVVLVNGIILLIIRAFGLLNNIFVGSAYFIVNIFIVYKIGLLKRDDVAMFLNPIKNKFSNIFKSEEII